MIAAGLQLLAFVRSLSARTWLVTIALVAMLTAAARLVNYGERREATRVAVRARAETISADVGVLNVARTEQGTVLAALTTARATALETAAARSDARKETTIDSLPATVIALIRADDAQIAADSIYIVTAESLVMTIPKVEAAHAVLDTVLTHPIEPSGDESSWHSASRVMEIGGVAFAGRTVWNLLKHRPAIP